LLDIFSASGFHLVWLILFSKGEARYKREIFSFIKLLGLKENVIAFSKDV